MFTMLNLQTNKLMENSRTLRTNAVFVCYLLLKEANIHINLICFDHNFDHPHVTVVPRIFLQNLVFAEKVFDMFGLSSIFR